MSGISCINIGGGNIKVTLLVLLLLSCSFYIFLGIYTFKIDRKSEANQVFLNLTIFCGLWAGGYAMMLTSDNVSTAFWWRGISVFSYCFFPGHWLCFAFILYDEKKIKRRSIIRILAHIPAILLFMSNVIVEPSQAMIKEYYGWIDVAPNLLGQIAYSIWAIFCEISGIIIFYLRGKHSTKNRVKKQTKIILVTYLISFLIGITTDFILPMMQIVIFPTAILIGTIALGGACYAINKHRMMISAPKYSSEYIFNTVNEPIFILGENFVIQNCNETALNITNYSFKELEGRIFREFIQCEKFDFNTLMENGYVKNAEVKLQKKQGDFIICELSSTVIYDEYSDILGIMILLHDVSERKKISEIERNYTLKLEETNLMLKNQIKDRISAEEQIIHHVNYDALTELPNRKFMLENLNKLLEGKNKRFAILFVDLDGFKHVNDNFGHQAGDKVLKNVALTLKHIIGHQDTISRIGGDEFIIILQNLKSYSYIYEIASKIQKTLKKPFVYNEERLIVGASIGISVSPDHGRDADTLINNADLAMYEVKKNGGYDHAIYSVKMKEKVIDKLEMKMKLNKALEDNEFVTYYQPILDLKSMKVLCSEALIRWRQGDKINLPMEFIPIAKSVGEIIPIDNWMLENACKQCKRWNEVAKDKISISVNTSYSQLKQPEFVSIVRNILESNELPPEYLNLEITEDEAMEDFETIIDILTQFKNMGIKILLDDFGTGYSSLSYVNRLPIDKLKIDRSLIMNLEKDYKSTMIVKSIIKMAHSLDIRIVAEGIETEKQFEILKKFGCDRIQGYFIGKPMEASEFEEKFINNKAQSNK